MHLLDWIVVGLYLVWMVWDGIRRTEGSDKVEGYLLANRSLPWWAVGLSVMATQLSAITLVGATGQGYADGMRFVQFYFGLPIAMIILSVTLVPFFYRARVYTAYEYLERRFDLKTRTLASVLFLCSRGLSCGVIIAAPAVILSIILGWNLTLTILAIGLPTAIYTMVGGVQAVTWTDVKQMAVIVVGLLAVVIALVLGLPSEVSVGDALHVAGAAGRLTAVDFRFDWTQTYTFWSGLLGGLFLMLSYFGCDQSQVQRYLTAKSVEEGRDSLMMSAFVKIPLQALVLLTGVLVFVFYLFQQPPLLFNKVHAERVEKSERAGEFRQLEGEFTAAFEARRAAAATLAATADDGASGPARATFEAANREVSAVRARAAQLVREITGDERYKDRTGDTPAPDVNYVFPTFVTTRLPPGLVGLIIAAIFAAAMSSIAAELNSLATSSVIDIYRRLLKPDSERCALSRRVEAVDRLLGHDRLPGRGLCGRPRLVDRSRQPVRVLFLRLPARRLRAGAGIQARDRHRGVRGPARRHGGRHVRGVSSRHQPHLVSLAQSHRRHRRGGRRRAREPDDAPASRDRMKTVVAAIGVAVLLGLPQSRPAARYDLAIVGGRVIDGSGAPPRRADVAIVKDHIAAIGTIAVQDAREVIDAAGLIVAPGFIDVHTHADDLEGQPLAENFVRMGVTTIVAGNCGSSALDVGEALAGITRTGAAINFATLIGHNTVRSAIMGSDNRLPTIPELAKMRSLVWRAMADGAVGFSTGLQYVPGTYAKAPEVIDLARVAGNAGGVYATHMRNEGTELEAAVEESIRVGFTTGARVQISHLKVDSPSRWGASEKALAMIDAARSPRRRGHGRSVRRTRRPARRSASAFRPGRSKVVSRQSPRA